MSRNYTEPEDILTPYTRDMHRALESMQEELEAIDLYNQRIDASSSSELKEILIHNRDDETEHFAMLLEYVRRHYPSMDKHLKMYLFTEEQNVLDIQENNLQNKYGKGGDTEQSLTQNSKKDDE